VSRLHDRRESQPLIHRRAADAFPGDPAGIKLVDEIAAPFVQPNVLYDQAETDWRRVQAQGVVPTVLGVVQKDELIVDANQRVSREALLKLHSLRDLDAARRQRSEFVYPPVARMLLMLLFIAVFCTYLRVELPVVFRDNAMLAVFTLLTVVVMASAELLVGVIGLSEFTVPLALAPLVVASLMEKRPALVFTLLLTVLATSVIELRAPFIPVAVMGGVTAVYSVARLRHRWHFLRANLTIGLANLAAILAWDLARVTSAQALAQDALWGALNSFLAITLAFLVLPVVEHLFGLTSDITLLELSDLNRPLLRRLQLEAPGTYHHSMVVGNLAERGAEAVGANSLLARVSAYYHDIGKLAKPEYYAENEPASSKSRHEQLAPSMSALVVKGQIREGFELEHRESDAAEAKRWFPPHHGTMVMAFFYVKAQEHDPSARREDYAYPGPKPRSKETAILMLSDGVEGLAGVAGAHAESHSRRGRAFSTSACRRANSTSAGSRSPSWPRSAKRSFPCSPRSSTCAPRIRKIRRNARRPMPISVASPRRLAGVASPLRALVRLVLAGEGRRAHEVDVSLADDALLRELNRTYRGIDRATDVLAFPYHEGDGAPIEGDIVISLEQLEEQARRFKVTQGHELARLVIHSTLHLAGHDHHKPGETSAMRAAETLVLAPRQSGASVERAFGAPAKPKRATRPRTR
jgi:rRNA maturation RNase YbeY